jgi:hypothetical protein
MLLYSFWGRKIMSELVKLDSESMDQVSGGYGFNEERKGGYAVKPTQENEKINVMNLGTKVTLTSRKVDGELIWSAECAGGNMCSEIKDWSICKNGYMEDEYGNKINGSLMPIINQRK